jgi:hypothetical protein
MTQIKGENMKGVRKLAPKVTLSGVVVVLAAWFSACPRPAAAQGTQGQNTICSSSSGCSTVGSSAFKDASQFVNSSDTFCSTIYKILGSVSYSASVIDARGLPGNTVVSMVCANGTTPWFNGTTFLNVPSTILLPAGIITIPSTWVLPGGTKLIGEGSEIPTLPVSASLSGLTMIQACTSSISGCSSNLSGAMIQFGEACPGIGTIRGRHNPGTDGTFT